MKLAKAEAIYRPNLLINSDFQVWQRGDSVSVASSQKGYTADRWLLQNNRTDVPITAYRIYDGSENPTVQQYYESYGSGISALTVSSARFLYLMDIEEAKKYEGKTVVLSYSLNKEITVNEPYTFTITETDKTNGYVQCFYRLMDIGEVLNWVKLELGSIATPLVPRLHAEELLLCQRYYQILGKIIAARYDYSSNYSYFTGCRFSEMRAIPSVSIVSNENLVYQPHETTTKSISYFSLNGDKDATDLTVYLDAEIK